MDSEEDKIRLDLEKERQTHQAQLEAEGKERMDGSDHSPKMSRGLLFAALTLSAIQFFIDWLSVGTIGFFVGLPINGLLYLLLRKYRHSIKNGTKILRGTLIFSALPGVGLIPADVLGILYVYVKSQLTDRNRND